MVSNKQQQKTKTEGWNPWCAGSIGMITGLRLSQNTRHIDQVVLVGRDSLKHAMLTEQHKKQKQDPVATKNGTSSTAMTTVMFRLIDHTKATQLGSRNKEEIYPYRSYDVDKSQSPGSERLRIAFNDVSALRDCDVILIAVKTVDTKAVAMALAQNMLTDSILAKKYTTPIIISFQNGIRNAGWMQEIFQKECKMQAGKNNHNVDYKNDNNNNKIEILSSVVAFSAEWEQNTTIFHMNTPGHCIIERPKHQQSVPTINTLVEALNKEGIHCHTTVDIEGRKYAKLLINLVNPINALSGMSVPIMLTKQGYRQIWIVAIQEAVNVIRQTTTISTIRLLPALAVGTILPIVLSLPDWVFMYFVVPSLPPRYKSSMLQDLERGRKTEIDELCGEIVRLAKTVNTSKLGHPVDQTLKRNIPSADVNAALVRLIHEIEEKSIVSMKNCANEGSSCSAPSLETVSVDRLLAQVGLN